MSSFVNTEKALDEYARRTLTRAREILKTPNALWLRKGRKKSNTGQLARSLGSSVRKTNEKLTVEFISTANYASIVEEGRDPNNKFPPRGLIDRWVVQRNIKGSRNDKGQFVKRKSLVFLISRKIAKDGIRAFPYMGTAMDEEFDDLPPYLQQALVDDMEDLIIDNFQKSKFVDVNKV